MNNIDEIIIRVIKRYIGNNEFNYIVNLDDLNDYKLSDVFILDLTEDKQNLSFFLREPGFGEYSDIYHEINFDPITGNRIVFNVVKGINISEQYSKALKIKEILLNKGEDLTNDDKKAIFDLTDITRPINCVKNDKFQNMLKGE